MRKVISILVTLLASTLFCLAEENSFEPESDLLTSIDTTLNIQTAREGNLTIYKIDKHNIVVVKIPCIDSYLFFKQPGKSLQQIATDSNYAVVVNASYFDWVNQFTKTNYKHAGFLKIDNTVYEDIKEDKQLSRLFAYNSKKNIVDYFDIADLDKTKNDDLVVQTGPQIIQNNEIDTASIDASKNGNKSALRTAFGSINGNEFYIIAALEKVTLKDLGKILLTSGIFRKELNIINFDGGPSTSLYIRNHPEFCWSSQNRLPFLMGIK